MITCRFCGNLHEPCTDPRKFKGCLISWYECPEYGLRYRVGWDAASLGEAAAA